MWSAVQRAVWWLSVYRHLLIGLSPEVYPWNPCVVEEKLPLSSDLHVHAPFVPPHTNTSRKINGLKYFQEKNYLGWRNGWRVRVSKDLVKEFSSQDKLGYIQLPWCSAQGIQQPPRLCGHLHSCAHAHTHKHTCTHKQTHKKKINKIKIF